MSTYSTHLSVLDATTSLHPDAVVFKVPITDLVAGTGQEWDSITYRRFSADVQRFARYWARALNAQSIPPRSVVGLWLGGMTYNDVLHIYGLSRAGYIPQLFSLRLPSPVVIFELLLKAKAKALIVEPSFGSSIDCSPVPLYMAVNDEDVEDTTYPPPSLPTAVDGDDTVFVFHTSGSTSGSPKLVPCSYRWLDIVVRKARQISTPKNQLRQDVTVWMGSMCHIGQTTMLIGSIQHASCIIQPTKLPFSTDELFDMVSHCGLNRLNQFAAFLTAHFRNARHNPKVLALLMRLDEVLYSGMPLPNEEQEWAYRNGIKLRNLFGSTECSAMLCSDGTSDRSLRPLDGVSYAFLPIAPEPTTESGHQSNARILELVILNESRDCPHSSLRQSDGHYHTGDLFQQVKPGSYIFCGRDDDWIKSENSLRCDTKAIEDNVRMNCGKVIEECVVVGTGRPSPALFVEAAPGVDAEKLKKEIIRKTRQFHSRRYLHERITSTDMIIVVPRQSLPRTATKGNVRRKAVEEAYKDLLDRIYGVAI